MSFSWLPPEIQQRILHIALQLEPRAAQQITNLSLTSRDCYAAVTRLTWKHIRVTRPSTLRFLHVTLTSNPALGELVQSIHIGPEDDLELHGWPLLANYQLLDWPIPLLITTLKEAELPRWVKPGSAFPLEQPIADCKNRAVTAALQQAVVGLDVEPYRRGYSRKGCRIGIRAWAARLWEAQAVLDLYLKEVRRIEDARAYDIVSWRANEALSPLAPLDELCQLGICGHYPALEVEQTGKYSRSSNRNRLVVTQSQIRSQLARRDGPANHFEHPILFSRSSRAGLSMTEAEWASVKYDLGGPDHETFSDTDFKHRWEEDDVFAAKHSLREEGREGGRDEENETASSDEEYLAGQASVGPLQPRPESAGDCLAMARQVLAATSQVTNLSLTGFFSPALDGLHTSSQLRSLTLGPLSRCWPDLLPVISVDGGAAGLPSLSNLAKLRICGLMSRKDAGKIAFEMPRLRNVVWEMTRNLAYHRRAIRVICDLQAQRLDARETKGQRSGQEQGTKRITVVRLHPQTLHYVLTGAPSPETSRAWKEGRAVPGALHTVKVRRSSNVNTRARRETLTAAQYAEGRKWWEEGRVGVGLHSEVG